MFVTSIGNTFARDRFAAVGAALALPSGSVAPPRLPHWALAQMPGPLPAQHEMINQSRVADSAQQTVTLRLCAHLPGTGPRPYSALQRLRSVVSWCLARDLTLSGHKRSAIPLTLAALLTAMSGTAAIRVRLRDPLADGDRYVSGQRAKPTHRRRRPLWSHCHTAVRQDLHVGAGLRARLICSIAWRSPSLVSTSVGTRGQLLWDRFHRQPPLVSRTGLTDKHLHVVCFSAGIPPRGPGRHWSSTSLCPIARACAAAPLAGRCQSP